MAGRPTTKKPIRDILQAVLGAEYRAHDGLRILLEALKLLPETPVGSQIREPLLIAIDFENIKAARQAIATGEPNTQVGVAILDTRDIESIESPGELISTFNFVTDSSEHFRQAQFKFMFGEPILVKPSALLANIQDCIPKGREIIVVGHNIENELHILARRGFDFEESGIAGCLDTHSISREVLSDTFALGRLLAVLKCPFGYLHNTGTPPPCSDELRDESRMPGESTLLEGDSKVSNPVSSFIQRGIGGFCNSADERETSEAT